MKLFDATKIDNLTTILAKKITKDVNAWSTQYRDSRDLTVVILMNGGFMVAADVIRKLRMDIRVVPIRTSSYGHGTSSSGTVSINMEQADEKFIKNHNILVIDDIYDTGLTASKVLLFLMKKEANRVKFYCLLDKNVRKVQKKVVVVRDGQGKLLNIYDCICDTNTSSSEDDETSSSNLFDDDEYELSYKITELGKERINKKLNAYLKRKTINDDDDDDDFPKFEQKHITNGDENNGGATATDNAATTNTATDNAATDNKDATNQENMNVNKPSKLVLNHFSSDEEEQESESDEHIITSHYFVDVYCSAIIPANYYVYGYGMDFNGLCRNNPNICYFEKKLNNETQNGDMGTDLLQEAKEEETNTDLSTIMLDMKQIMVDIQQQNLFFCYFSSFLIVLEYIMMFCILILIVELTLDIVHQTDKTYRTQPNHSLAF